MALKQYVRQSHSVGEASNASQPSALSPPPLAETLFLFGHPPVAAKVFLDSDGNASWCHLVYAGMVRSGTFPGYRPRFKELRRWLFLSSGRTMSEKSPVPFRILFRKRRSAISAPALKERVSAYDLLSLQRYRN
jgi:hypothetical protein